MTTAIESNKTIAEWELAKHIPSGKIFVVTEVSRGYTFDHCGVKYGLDQCSHYFTHCGLTTQQLVKYNKPEFSPLRECWKRAKSQAWEGCDLKIGDVVFPKYGKQAGQRLQVQLFDHLDKTVGVGNYQYWYPEKYLIVDGDRPVTVDMFDGDERAFEVYMKNCDVFEQHVLLAVQCNTNVEKQTYEISSFGINRDRSLSYGGDRRAFEYAILLHGDGAGQIDKPQLYVRAQHANADRSRIN